MPKDNLVHSTPYALPNGNPMAAYCPLAQGWPNMAIDQSSPNEYQDTVSQDNAMSWPDFSVLHLG